MPTASDNAKSAFPMLDMMMNLQRIGLQAMSAYEPLTTAFLDSAIQARRAPRTDRFRSLERRDSFGAAEERVIGVGEEVLNVGTRMVPGKTTRVRRVVVENPVEKEVTLHTETVVMERRKPIEPSGRDILTEVTVEMSDFNEVPVVSKSVHLVEEVLLRKEVTARVETIRDTVRRDTLEIEQPSKNLPVVFQPNQKQDEKERSETALPQPNGKSSDANRS